VGLLTAGGERGQQSDRAAPHQWRASDYVQTMQAIQGMATHTNETNKHCVAIAAQPAGIKA